MSSELFHTIELIGREKGLETDIVIEALEEAYAAATRKYYSSKQDFGARFDRDSGKFEVFSKHTVVEEDDLADPNTEIALDEAKKLHPDAELGIILETPFDYPEAPLTRIAAQAAKQVIYQKVKEAERELVYKEYCDRVGELMTGVVKRFDRGDMILDLGRTEGIVHRREQSRAEHYNPGDRVRTVLLEVERLGKGPQLIMSRGSGLLVNKLFEMEVPEIYDGTVMIVNVARDSGERSKVAVASKDRDVDPVGACVGMKGSRVQAVIRELRGEKIDIVQFDEDDALYVRNALNPAQINRVVVRDYETREMEVIVAEDQLSLAIGKRGQNVRLASKLVGWSLDIKSETEKKEEVEAEMERMQVAMVELGSLPDIEGPIVNLLLEVGFRTMEEVSLASLEDLVSIEGIEEDVALDIHDAAEELLEKWAIEPPEHRVAAAAREAELERLANEPEMIEEDEEDEKEEETDEAIEAEADNADSGDATDASNEIENESGDATTTPVENEVPAVTEDPERKA